jgi:hypothetical protein
MKKPLLKYIPSLVLVGCSLSAQTYNNSEQGAGTLWGTPAIGFWGSKPIISTTTTVNAADGTGSSALYVTVPGSSYSASESASGVDAKTETTPGYWIPGAPAKFPYPKQPDVWVPPITKTTYTPWTDSIRVSYSIPTTSFSLTAPTQTPVYKGGNLFQFDVTGTIPPIPVSYNYTLFQNGSPVSTGTGVFDAQLNIMTGIAYNIAYHRDTLFEPRDDADQYYLNYYSPKSSGLLVDTSNYPNWLSQHLPLDFFTKIPALTVSTSHTTYDISPIPVIPLDRATPVPEPFAYGAFTTLGLMLFGFLRKRTIG